MRDIKENEDVKMYIKYMQSEWDRLQEENVNLRAEKTTLIQTIDDYNKRGVESFKERQELARWLDRIYNDKQNKACSVRVEELIKKYKNK